MRTGGLLSWLALTGAWGKRPAVGMPRQRCCAPLRSGAPGGGGIGGAPLLARDDPHHFEFVAVGVGAVDAFGGFVADLTRVGAVADQGGPGGGEIVDGVDLPRQVVEPDAASSR